MTQLSCHILDNASGSPATGVEVHLFKLGSSKSLAQQTTNDDGRCEFANVDLIPGQYTLRFLVGPYCEATFGEAFFPMIDVHITTDSRPHYHIPLLLSPFAYSSYRGS
ncbi:hydroxyisourate hydrolase [Vibrio nitrifigilis]|uniref:5-hydroxyisourate hydrolase n=1 Tax=Vibrio nitrifigilis TaxID=2789781 RepID=A0ABS0GJI6_9VIBR|nr:hydroxyisourate hydrolase [Vibrio nitrifigilis]MBF9002619.1 hydroxyisourate hydrolase [Vibrio nitrifigilis]